MATAIQDQDGHVAQVTEGGALHVHIVSGSGGGGVTDHGALTGLEDDDHPQYQLRTEKAAANGYASLGADGKVPADQLPAGAAPTDHGSLDGLADDDHTQYVRYSFAATAPGTPRTGDLWIET